MGKKDDWCSCQGLQNRKAGMEKEETKCKKICYAALFCVAAAWTLAVAGLSLWRADNAHKIDSYSRDFAKKHAEDGLDYSSANFYDSCSIPAEDYPHDDKAAEDAQKEYLDSCDLSDVTDLTEPSDYPSCAFTGWKLVFTFSGTVLVLMSCNFILLAVGGFCFWPRLIGTYINCGLAIFNFAAAITAIVSNTKPKSILCSYNKAFNTFKGDGVPGGEWEDSGVTYEDEYWLIMFIAVWQIIAAVLQVTICWMPIYYVPVKGAKRDQEEIAGVQSVQMASPDQQVVATGMAQAQPPQQMMDAQGQQPGMEAQQPEQQVAIVPPAGSEQQQPVTQAQYFADGGQQ